MEQENISSQALCDVVFRFSQCAICYSTLVQPLEVNCCNKLFCAACIRQWLNSRSTCPNCRVSGSSTSSNIPIQRLVEQIPMTCCYKVRGCNATPAFKDYDIHIERCEYKNSSVPTENHSLLDIIESMPNNPREAKQQLERIQIDGPEATILYQLANAYYLLLTGSLDSARSEYLRILGEAIESHGENHRNVIDCYEKLALLEKKAGKYSGAIEYYQRAISLIRSVRPVNELFITHCMIRLADVKRKVNDFDGAERDFNTVLGPGIELHDRVTCLRGLGLICKKNSRYDEALEYYNQVVELLDENNRDLGIIFADIGDVHRKREKHHEALNFYRKALQKLEATTGLENLDIVDIYCSMALSLVSANQIGEAERYVTLARQILGAQNHYKLGIAYSITGYILSMKGDYAEAYPCFMRAIDILSETLGEDDLEVADTRIRFVEASFKHREETKQLINVDIVRDMILAAQATYCRKYDESHYKVEQCKSYAVIL